jgi:2-keto-4-pentenoate hydratase/2-oxohepta-3-ene-1,7-dioic acid hydratase in catechol pathway
VDYEAELAVIIGKPGRGIQKEDALDHIFGYTILNDVTAREVQKRHQQAGEFYLFHWCCTSQSW